MKRIILVLLLLFHGIPEPVLAQKTMGTYQNLSAQIINSAKTSDVICLGEQSHGDTTTLNLKAEILQDIVGEVPTGALLFEAPLVTSVISYFRDESYSEFVWPFWKYSSLKTNLSQIIDQNNLICLGFDPQETCNFRRFTSFLISEGFLKNDLEMARMDSVFLFTIRVDSSDETRDLTNTEAAYIAGLIDKIKSKLHWPEGISKTKKDLISLCLENRKYLAKEMTFGEMDEMINFRDSIMALNIASLLKILKPEAADEKTLIWAANLHIARKRNGGTFMMERFAAHNPDKVLSIGLIPRKSKRKSKRFDYAVVAGKPEYMSVEMHSDYDCE